MSRGCSARGPRFMHVWRNLDSQPLSTSGPRKTVKVRKGYNHFLRRHLSKFHFHRASELSMEMLC
eukprot:6440552-Amphidinium_carterae.1